MNSINSVSFIGAGNVATNLAKSFYQKGIKIDIIYSNTIENAQQLAKTVEAKAINNKSEVNITSDLVIVALKDDVIDSVLSQININNSLLVHTSGSIDSASLSQYSTNYGCFYPFQTFRKEFQVNLSEVNLFIESNTAETTKSLFTFASLFSDKVVEMNSKERKSLHIAGVGLNNFTHYLLSITKQYCEDSNLNPAYLTNLLTQTVNNSFYVEKSLALQTGPARRGDLKIIENHISSLESSPKYQKIYKTISQLILDEFHENQFKL